MRAAVVLNRPAPLSSPFFAAANSSCRHFAHGSKLLHFGSQSPPQIKFHVSAAKKQINTRKSGDKVTILVKLMLKIFVCFQSQRK